MKGRRVWEEEKLWKGRLGGNGRGHRRGFAKLLSRSWWGTRTWQSNAVLSSREGRGLGRGSVRVGCCVSFLVVVKECGEEIARSNRGVNEDVAIECGV